MTNRTQDPDKTLAAWFEEGPTVLPESTRRSIATTVRTTTQERRGFGQPWRFPMNGWARYAVLAAAVAVIAVGGWYLLGSPHSAGGRAGSPSATVPASVSAPSRPSASPVISCLAVLRVHRHAASGVVGDACHKGLGR